MYILLEQAGLRLQRSAARLDEMWRWPSADRPLYQRCRLLGAVLFAHLVLIAVGALFASRPLILFLIPSTLLVLGLYHHSNSLLNRALEQARTAGTAQADTDALTGLASRNALRRRLVEALEHARRNGTLVGAVIVRIDNWPQLLAAHGNAQAEAIVREAARRIQNSLRQTDLAGRVEQAQFELVLCNLKSRRGMEVVIRRLQAACNEPVTLDAGLCSVRATVGAAIFPYDAEQPDDLFDTAHADGEALRFRSPKALVQALG